MTTTTTYQGILTFHSETGTEGGSWAFQDDKFTNLPAPPQFRCTRCGRIWDKDRDKEPPPPVFTYWRPDWTENGKNYIGGDPLMKRILLYIAIGGLIGCWLVLASQKAHADPYCGSGSNYDWRHSICQPGMPVPPGGDGVGVFPYPMPGQGGPGGYGQLPYGGN